MILARSCWDSDGRAWIAGTVWAQRRKKGRNTGGQVAALKNSWAVVPLAEEGMGTLGGLVFERRAAKKRQSAGPGTGDDQYSVWQLPTLVRDIPEIMTSASADAKVSSSNNPSNFA